MPEERSCDVLIAGAGPAGLATALHLLRLHPELRGRVIALEKSAHPRHKTCAGGLIPKTILALRELGIRLDVPAVTVESSHARTPVGDALVVRNRPVGTVIRRDQFDAMLARNALKAGLEIIEHCAVRHVLSAEDAVSVETDRGQFAARVLVGADGSGSLVRTSVFGQDKKNLGRALMADIPVDPSMAVEFTERRYRFDFRCVAGGIKGYAWSFPCTIDGRPHLNVGIYDQYPRESPAGLNSFRQEYGEQAAMLHELARAFPELELERMQRRELIFRAFPIRWFDQCDHYVKGRVILAGDAAGVDPLMGEGISYAFEHGKLAARAIVGFLNGDESALKGYDRYLHRGAVGWKLRKLAFAARHFYGPYHRLFFHLSRISCRAQEIGLDWYNGVDNIDETATPILIARWIRAVLFGPAVR